MMLRSCVAGRSARRSGALLVLIAAIGPGRIGLARGDDGPRIEPPSVARPAAGGDIPEVSSTLRYRGTPVPGARLAIELEGSSDPDANYRWVQLDGPPVAIGDQAGPKLVLTVPPDAKSLGFLLSIRDSQGQRNARVVIPIESKGSRDEATPSDATPLADAGDDQIGLVGRRITLNGSRSVPREEVAYRWLALGGPKVDRVTQEGCYYAFIPTAPGTYRFGLVVASAQSGEPSISELDEVLVTVGEVPSAVGLNAPGFSGVSTSAIDQMLRGPGGVAGRETLEQAATIFEAIAGRSSLYSNFGDLSSEMTRRLDAIIPTDPNWRRFWSEGVFAPLTQHLTGEMLAAGLDLRGPYGQAQTLSPAHQDRLRKLFTAYAREFQSKAQSH